MDTLALFDQRHRVSKHGQGAKPQEIHFQKSQFLDGGHGKLRGDGAVRSS